MNMCIKNLLNNLSWNKPKSIQEDAIKQLLGIEKNKLVELVQPNGKDCWLNAAIVLKKIGYPDIEDIVFDLLEWLKDLNWPGAIEIKELLCTIPQEKLIIYIEDAILKAVQANDSIWLYWIKDLIETCQIMEKDFIDKNKYYVIKKLDFK